MLDEIKQVEIDKIYREMPLEKIPWNVETPPEAMVELVRSGGIRPCKTIDLGCGAGNQAVYLAGMGFSMTGIDSSPAAIEIAREHAGKKGIAVNFIVADVLGDLHEVQEKFDFAYDWELLHHIYPEQRETYVANVHRLLNEGGKYLSVCFSENDTQFGGSGKYRKTALGTVLYFSSEDELQKLFEKHFSILELKTIEISGKFVNHLANYVYMERR
jgi:2-polyprenyl-3-methyl-5-hydroxy-6-metoxy-1,4-benzoquinol methylase